MKLTIVEKKTFLAGLQCTLTSSCAKKDVQVSLVSLVRQFSFLTSFDTANKRFSELPTAQIFSAILLAATNRLSKFKISLENTEFQNEVRKILTLHL